MSNISNLFENLMMYNDSHESLNSKKHMKESDETLLNLSINLPEDLTDVDPEDVEVNVGIMNVEKDEEDQDEENKNEKDDENPDEQEENSDESTENNEDDEEVKEESSDLIDLDETDKEHGEDCECEACKVKKEASDVETAKDNIRKRVNNETSSTTITEAIEKDIKSVVEKFKKKNNKLIDFVTDNKTSVIFTLKNTDDQDKLIKEFNDNFGKNDFVAEKYGKKIKVNAKKEIKNEAKDKDNIKVKDLKVGTKLYMEIPGDSKNPVKTIKELTGDGGIIFTDGAHVELNKNDYVKLYKESLLKLDANSINKLFTNFVKDNYKNIDKVVISKAVLENKMLKLEGTITNTLGKSETISITNRGFDNLKLEGKRFIMDFKDTSNTFGIIKENVNKPFIFTASLKNGILKFESLKYNFKTKITEGKIANVYGTCNVLKESKTLKEATLKPMTKEDSFGWQGANNFEDDTKPFIADGVGGTLIVSGSDKNDGTALISIYYGPDSDQWAWKSYDSKETALKDARVLVNLVDDEEVDVKQLERFGFDIM